MRVRVRFYHPHAPCCSATLEIRRADHHGILSRVTSLELPPSVAAALTLVAMAVYGGFHSFTASLWAKARAREALGPTAGRLYRLAYNLLGGITFLPVLAIPAVQPGPQLYLVSAPWSWFMLGLQATGAGIVVLGLLQTDVWHFLGVRQLVGPADDRPARLATTGLYRHVRHPLYSGALLFLWATPLMTSTLLALVLGVSLYLFVGSVFEERRLLAEFGAAYADYQRRVPRLIPRPFARRENPPR